MEEELARLKSERQAAKAAAKALKLMARKRSRVLKAAKGLSLNEMAMLMASKAQEQAAGPAAI